MPNASSAVDADDRRAVLGLWAVPGLGAKSIELIRQTLGSLGPVLDEPVAKWCGAVKLKAPALEGLSQVECIAGVADRVVERARRSRMGIAFQGDPAYPARLAEAHNAPPLLFYRGPACSSRRRVAMVGSRKVLGEYEEDARLLAEAVALRGVGIVSGAAAGIDTACHLGALRARGETWAFVGSALDELDSAQAELQGQVLPRGGTFYSELPPGVRAEARTFPRRNRLISGAADVVVVVRAGLRSGALHTSKYAKGQGRTVMAVPGEVRAESAQGCNELLRQGATICLEAGDVFRALDLGKLATLEAAAGVAVDWEDLSPEARTAFAALRREPSSFEDLLAATAISSGALSSALCELELLGVVLQRPGKRFERV
ncbi:MAG: DNA-processing protein DprA [Myxococcaceae bacterium]